MSIHQLVLKKNHLVFNKNILHDHSKYTFSGFGDSLLPTGLSQGVPEGVA